MLKGIKFKEFLNTTEEFHALILGFCYPAVQIWRANFITHYQDMNRNDFVDEIKKEPWYFMSGLLLSTVLMIALLIAAIVFITWLR